MPYNADGTFTPVPGAITAQAGDVIRSSTWDNINTDYQVSFTTLGRQIVQAARVISAAGNLQITTTDSRVIIQAGAPVINLPASSTRTFPVTIMGGAVGIFSANPSVLTPNGTETISGQATVTLSSDFQVITLWPLPSGGYLIQ